MPLGQRIAQVLVTLIIWAVATRAWLAHGSPVDVHGVIAWNGGMDMTPRRLPTALAPRRPLRRPLGLLSPERNSRERNSLEHGLRPSHRHFTTGSNMLGGTATPRLRHVDRLPPLHVFGSQPPSAPNSGGDQGGEDYTSPDLQHWFQSEDFDAAIDGMFEELQGSATANAIKADSDNVLRLEDVRLNPLLVDEALMREEAMRLRVVNYMQAVYVARKRPMLVQAKDEVRGRLNDVAMHRMLRFVPSYAVAERFWSDALFWYWRYRGEGLNIPLMVIAGAALQVESSIAEIKLEKEQVVGKSYDLAVPPSSVEELSHLEEYRRWELKTINDDHQQFENTLHDCGNLLRTAKRIRVNEASTSSFPSILQTLNDLRHCAPDSLRGNAIASADLLTRPWPLFYLAERYFLENDTPRHERIIAMAHLAHAIYTLPRSHQAEKPWPTDVLMLLSDYELLVPAYIDRHAPEAQWITFIINVQDEFSVQVDRLAADLRFAGPSETFAPFERALSRAGSTVKVRDVLQLYQRLASSIRTSPRLSPKEEFPRTDGLTGLESAMMVNRATRIGYRMVKKLRQDQDRPRRHVGGLRTGHYLRLITLMHEQLDEHTFCQTVGALTRDMEEFGLGPDIGGLVRAASSSVHSACRWSGAVAKAVGNVMARRREVVDKP